MYKKISIVTVISFFLLISSNIFAASSPVGLWKTVDDKTGKAKSVVKVWAEKGKLYGKILLLIGEKQDELCTKCKGSKHNKPIIGMKFLYGFQEDGDEWTGGTVLDPEDGQEYRGKIWCEGSNKLKLRGYVFVFYRTQTWIRINKAEKDSLFKKEGVSIK